MQTYKIGKVSLFPKGEYDPLQTYSRLDIVEYQGSSYIVMRDGAHEVIPTNDKVNYVLLAEKGEPYTHSAEFEALVKSLAETEGRVTTKGQSIDEAVRKFAEGYARDMQAYNDNHDAKMKLYNDNNAEALRIQQEKLDGYNRNHTQKVEEYNANVVEKENAFDLKTQDQLSLVGKEAEKAGQSAREAKASEEYVKESTKKCNDTIKGITIQTNLFDSKSVKLGGYYGKSGELVSDEGCWYSEEFIEIIPNIPYAWSSGRLVISTYDSNKRWLERIITYTPVIFTTKAFNSDVKYVRLSMHHDKLPKVMTFCEGTTIPALYHPDDIYIKKSLLLNDCNYVKYNKTPNSEGIESLDIVMGNIQYILTHTVDMNKSVDVWRIKEALYKKNNKWNSFTTRGEWEMAIQTTGQTDFSGGFLHGNEKMIQLIVIVDGKVVTLEQLKENEYFNCLQIIQTSNLYLSNSPEIVFAKHGSNHTFENGILKIDQTLEFKDNYTVGKGYSAMFPISKESSKYYMTDSDYTIKELTTTTNVTEESAGLTLTYSEGYPISKFYIAKYPQGQYAPLLITDNHGQGYNKMYFILPVNAEVTANEKWKSTTVYDIKFNE